MSITGTCSHHTHLRRCHRLPTIHVLSYRQFPVSMKDYDSMIGSDSGATCMDSSTAQVQSSIAKIGIYVACREGHNSFSAYTDHGHALRLHLYLFRIYSTVAKGRVCGQTVPMTMHRIQDVDRAMKNHLSWFLLQRKNTAWTRSDGEWRCCDNDVIGTESP